MKKKILIIDDDIKLNFRLKKYLGSFDFDVITSTNPHVGIKKNQNEKPDLIILDYMMPELNGFEVLKVIRKQSNVPVIMLTARGDVTDKIIGLELGADDYLSKPFEPRELVARIHAIIKRTVEDTDLTNKSLRKFGYIVIDNNKHTAFIDGKDILLTNMEFNILKIFTNNAGKVLERNFLMEKLSGFNIESFDRSIDILISRLRKKILDDPKNPQYIKTLRGAGYIFLKEETYDF